MQFTEKQILSLKAKAARYEVREKSGKGFAIRITSSGDKSWVFFYTFDGRKRRMTLGNYPALSLSEARGKHREALNILAHGRDPGLEKQNSKREDRLSFTVKELINEYIEKWAKPRKRSWKEDQRILTKDVEPFFKGRKAKDITKRDIVLLLYKIRDRKAPIAANRTLACVRKMFNFAVDEDIITNSPCASVKAQEPENRRERCLSLDEIKIFWQSLSNAKMSSTTKLALKLQLVTAQRKGEIVSAEWEEIDLNSGWWTIPGEKSKNRLPHRVPLSNLAIELLIEAKKISKESPWVFPSPRGDKHLAGTSVDHAVRRNIQKDIHGNQLIKLNHLTPHDLRRSAATHIAGMDIQRLIVSKLLNHVENSVTAIYDRHTYDAEKKHALNAWGMKLEEIINENQSSNNIILLRNIGASK